jgi:hypothetical protein
MIFAAHGFIYIILYATTSFQKMQDKFSLPLGSLIPVNSSMILGRKKHMLNMVGLKSSADNWIPIS